MEDIEGLEEEEEEEEEDQMIMLCFYLCYHSAL